jgi:DNA-binding NtrC family response regulator
MMQRILFVSDVTIDQSLRSALEERRFELAESDSRRDLNELTIGSCDLLIIDVRAATQAIELLKKVRSATTLRKVLTLVIAEWGTGQPTLALSEGADAFEPAPIDAPRLVAAVEKLLRPRMVMTAKASTAEGESDE